MKNYVKTFDQFKTEVNESIMNESFSSALYDIGLSIKGAIKKLEYFFVGTGSSFLNMLVAQKDKKLPKGIYVFPVQSDIDLLKKNGINVQLKNWKDIVKIKDPSFRNSTEEVLEGFTYKRYFDLFGENEAINEADSRGDALDLKAPNNEVPDVDAKNLLRTTDAAVNDPKGAVVMIWGAPGIAKTALVETVAKKYYGENAREKRRFIVYDLMTMMPEEFMTPGLSNKEDPKKTRGKRYPDGALPLYNIEEGKAGDDAANGPDGKGGIIYLDEIARCRPSVQSVCLGLVNERRLGDWNLGSKWTIIVTANREDDESDESPTFHFNSTLGNRFQQINYAPTLKDWMTTFVDTDHNMDDDGKPIVGPDIVIFLENNKDCFYSFYPRSGAKGNYIYATPRSWTNAARRYKKEEERFKKNGEEFDEEYQMLIFSGFIGKTIARKFMDFKKLIKKVKLDDIKNVWENEKALTVKFSSLKLDEEMAFMAAVISAKIATKLTKNNLTNFIQWVINLKDPTWAMKAMVMITNTHPELVPDDAERSKQIKSELKLSDEMVEYWNRYCKQDFFEAYPMLKTQTK